MKLALRTFAFAGIAALPLACAGAIPADASYLGYGNGDPGPWDFWQEQNGGKPLPAEAEDRQMAARGIYYNMVLGRYEYPPQRAPGSS